MLQLQNLILEMIAKGEPLQATTDRLCLEIEQRLPGVVSSILAIDREGFIHPLSGPSLPRGFSAVIEGVAIGPQVGSCGSAAFLRAPVAVTDIGSDPRWQAFNALPWAAGLRACWSCPICDGQARVIATFAFYYREHRGPTPVELEAVQTCTHLCTIALERHGRVLERERRAYVDALTELPNRASFDLTLARLPTAEYGCWALLLLDIDDFKVVNDTFGHQIGDVLLETVARRIAEAVAPHTAFRLGGDEFAIVVEGEDVAQQVGRIAADALAALAAPVEGEDHVLMPSASIGVAVHQPGDRDAEAVQRNADFALYHAKATDRGGVVLHAPRLGSAMMHRAGAVRDLAEALAEGRIDAYYQPVVRLDSREIVGVEALCRLITETGQLVPAAAFQDAMADARIASKLTRRMMEIVAADVRHWLDMGLPFQQAFVNVASPDVHGGLLGRQIAECFGAAKVPLHHVVIEVTETVYMRQGDLAVPRVIRELRADGLLVALDDFGTGFASLTHLLTVPVDMIKIDKSFIAQLGPAGPSSVIVEGLVGIARKLGTRVVAEGVETDGQLALLRNFGCALGQGYLFSEPVDRHAATRLFERRVLPLRGRPVPPGHGPRVATGAGLPA